MARMADRRFNGGLKHGGSVDVLGGKVDQTANLVVAGISVKGE